MLKYAFRKQRNLVDINLALPKWRISFSCPPRPKNHFWSQI